MSRGIALLFSRTFGTRWVWWVSPTPRPLFTTEKDPLPIVQEAGRAPGPVWTGGKSRPNRDSIPDSPACSQSLQRLSYTHPHTHTHTHIHTRIYIIIIIINYLFTAVGLSPGGSGYFTCKRNMNLVTTRFKSGGLHEKHVVATWNVGNRLSICL